MDDKHDFQSGEVLFDIAKSEYQNEHSRTSVIDSKVGIALPIVATYFFLVLQYSDVKTIFANKVDTTSVATVLYSVSPPILYIATLLFAVLSLVFLFQSIVTHSYKTIDPASFNEKEKLDLSKATFSAVMVTYYIRATDHNRNTNDSRVVLYKRGWEFALISLGLFVLYVFLKH